MAEPALGDPELLPNGNLLIPVRVEDEDGTVGDTKMELFPDDPLYPVWARFLPE